MNGKSSNFELVEPIAPEALVPDSRVEAWMILIGVVLIAAVIAAVVRQRRKAGHVSHETIRQAAHTAAVATLEQIRPVHARDAAVQTSLILRRYVATAAGDPALYETHEETITRHEALKEFSESARVAADAGFERLAALKYSPEISETAASEVVADSRTLLETLHHGFRP